MSKGNILIAGPGRCGTTVWIQQNIHLFPVVEETNEQDVVVE
jgi:hypothetical protein